MRLVIDTNVLLVSIGRASEHHWLFQAFLKEQFTLLVTTPILLEYYEIISERTRPVIAENVLKLILAQPNVEKVTVSYNFNLIYNDPDDNAFIDCAVAGNAHYIITNDRHFDVAKGLPFPTLNILKLEEFKEIFL